MIVNKINKGFQTRSDMPNTNWENDEEWYVVPDNSEWANKIMQLFPRYDLVLDEKEQIVDVIETPYTEKEIKQQEIEQVDIELEEIDKSTGLTRILEDIITHTGIYMLMYDSTKQIIERKKTLREKRSKLVREIESL